MNRKDEMKVLLITARADYGGGPEHLLTLVKGLGKTYRLFIACPREQPYWDLYRSFLNTANMFEIPHRKFSLLTLLRMVSFIRSNKIGIIHSHGRGAGVFSRLLKIFQPSVKVIHTFHGIHYEQRKFISRIIYLAAEKFFKRLTNTFINVSKGEFEEAARVGICIPQRSAVIYNSVFPPASTIGREELPKGLKTGDFVVLHISRFESVKNSQMVLEIADLIIKRDTAIQFILIGDGPQRSALENTARARGLQNVHFLGFRPQAGKYSSLARLYLATSHKEALGISLIESIAMGVPVIATNVQGHNEVVEHGTNGFLFPKDSPEAAAGYILKLKSEPALLSELGGSAKKTYHNKFRPDLMIKELKKLY